MELDHVELEFVNNDVSDHDERVNDLSTFMGVPTLWARKLS